MAVRREFFRFPAITDPPIHGAIDPSWWTTFRGASPSRRAVEKCPWLSFLGQSRPSMKVGFQVACSVDADHRLLKPYSWTVFWVVETSPIDVLSAHKQHIWRVFAHVEEIVVRDKITALHEAQ